MIYACFDDFTGEKDVISELEGARAAALKNGERSGQQGRAASAGHPRNIVETPFGFFGKADGKIALMRGQNVDAEEWGGPEVLDYGGLQIDADRN